MLNVSKAIHNGNNFFDIHQQMEHFGSFVRVKADTFKSERNGLVVKYEGKQTLFFIFCARFDHRIRLFERAMKEIGARVEYTGDEDLELYSLPFHFNIKIAEFPIYVDYTLVQDIYGDIYMFDSEQFILSFKDFYIKSKISKSTHDIKLRFNCFNGCYKKVLDRIREVFIGNERCIHISLSFPSKYLVNKKMIIENVHSGTIKAHTNTQSVENHEHIWLIPRDFVIKIKHAFNEI